MISRENIWNIAIIVIVLILEKILKKNQIEKKFSFIYNLTQESPRGRECRPNAPPKKFSNNSLRWDNLRTLS